MWTVVQDLFNIFWAQNRALAMTIPDRYAAALHRWVHFHFLTHEEERMLTLWSECTRTRWNTSTRRPTCSLPTPHLSSCHGEETDRRNGPSSFSRQTVPCSLWRAGGEYGRRRGREAAVSAGAAGQPLQEETLLLRRAGAAADYDTSLQQEYTLRPCQETPGQHVVGSDSWKFPGPSQRHSPTNKGAWGWIWAFRNNDSKIYW